MISSCPNYLYADVSDGEDLSRHQQEVTGGQLVTMSLLPGTVDSNVTSECHLCCPPSLPGKVSSVDSSWGLYASRLNCKKRKTGKVHLFVSVPLVKDLVKGDRVGTGLRGLQGVWHVVQVCLEGFYVCENVVDGSVEPWLVDFFGERCGGVCKNDWCLLIQCERVSCWLVTVCE